MLSLERAQRECGCPEWVVRCAHWDGQVLVLDETSEKQPGPRKHAGFRTATFLVGTHPERHKCDCCGTGVFMPSESQVFFETDDLPAAEAEFHRREQELVRSGS